MQPQWSSRIDLLDLKTQIVKRIGVEKSKKYFYCLNQFLSQKLSKSEFDRSCVRLLERDNLPLHNQLIRSILKNACRSKGPPQNLKAGPTLSVNQTGKVSPAREDGRGPSGLVAPSRCQDTPIWSNGVLPVSPKKVRSGTRDRKIRDRPSALGPNGKVDSLSHRSTEASGSKVIVENGDVTPCDYQRPTQYDQALAEQPRNENELSLQQPMVKVRTFSNGQEASLEDLQDRGQANHLNFCRSSLIAPLGIPLCPASVGGAHKPVPIASNSISCCNGGQLFDTDTLRKRMEQIAAAQGLGGVSMECANVLNSMLDVYLKRLIKSCVDLAGARAVNGIWSGNRLHMPSQSGPMEVVQEQGLHLFISLLDFKVAMEMNPHQIGENWPLLLEKICHHAFED